jgi:transcriptional regulator with XRE-family HTH domain
MPDEQSADETYGEYVKRRRLDSGFTQSELAKLIGRSTSWVSQIERGLRPVDRLSVREKLEQAWTMKPRRRIDE